LAQGRDDVGSVAGTSLLPAVSVSLHRYKKESSAIFVIQGVTVIVYRPKFIEYPQIVDIPKLLEVESKFYVELGPFQIDLMSKGSDTADSLVEATKQWISRYYATFYGKEGVKAADF